MFSSTCWWCDDGLRVPKSPPASFKYFSLFLFYNPSNSYAVEKHQTLPASHRGMISIRVDREKKPSGRICPCCSTQTQRVHCQFFIESKTPAQKCPKSGRNLLHVQNKHPFCFWFTLFIAGVIGFLLVWLQLSSYGHKQKEVKDQQGANGSCCKKQKNDADTLTNPIYTSHFRPTSFDQCCLISPWLRQHIMNESPHKRSWDIR